jgi:hypothetical protein
MEPVKKSSSLTCRYAIYSYNPQRCKEYFQNGVPADKPDESEFDRDEPAVAPNASFG